MSKLSDCVNFLDAKRVPLSSKVRANLAKNYPYYGAQGIVDYVDDYLFDGSYILVAEDGNNLKSLNEPITTWATGKFWVNNHAHILGEKDGYCLKYIYYLLTCMDLRGYITGSAQPKFNQDNLANVRLNLPELSTQKKISNVLTVLDEKTSNNNALCAELESMAKTLYDYWFTQFDFPDENGKPYRSSGGDMVWNEQLKREIPKGWNVGQLSDIANIAMGQSPAGETYNENGNGMIFYQGCTDFGTRFPVPRVYTTAPTRFAKSGDILMSVRAPVGTLNVAIEDCSIGRGLAALNSKIGSQLYLWYTLAGFKQLFNVLDGNGTTFGSITKDTLYETKVVIPNPVLVKSFEEIVQPIEQKIRIIEEENRELTKLRDWLLPMLMNGQAIVE